MNTWHIRRAALAVENGGVIACPTEAVYGLGCCPWDEQAVHHLLRLKRRPQNKGLIVVAAHVSQLHTLVCFDGLACVDTVLATWPGPVTWVLPVHRHTPRWLSGDHAGLAVRVSAHPLLRELCDLCGPLVSTSANLAGTAPARSAVHVRNYFHNSLDYILPGKLGTEAGPSEIRHAESGQVLRHSEVKTVLK